MQKTKVSALGLIARCIILLSLNERHLLPQQHSHFLIGQGTSKVKVGRSILSFVSILIWVVSLSGCALRKTAEYSGSEDALEILYSPVLAVMPPLALVFGAMSQASDDPEIRESAKRASEPIEEGWIGGWLAPWIAIFPGVCLQGIAPVGTKERFENDVEKYAVGSRPERQSLVDSYISLLFSSGSRQVYGASVLFLAHESVNSKPVRSKLIARYRQGSPRVKAKALEALGQLAPIDEIRALLQEAERANDPKLRALAARTLAGSGDVEIARGLTSINSYALRGEKDATMISIPRSGEWFLLTVTVELEGANVTPGDLAVGLYSGPEVTNLETKKAVHQATFIDEDLPDRAYLRIFLKEGATGSGDVVVHIRPLER